MPWEQMGSYPTSEMKDNRHIYCFKKCLQGSKSKVHNMSKKQQFIAMCVKKLLGVVSLFHSLSLFLTELF